MAEENAESTRGRKKLEKDLTEHPLVKITALGGSQGQMIFNFTDLPKEIQSKFGPFGLGHKLGDAAAGRQGIEAEEAITKVWTGLKEGNWTVRAPAVPKVSTKQIIENYQKLSSKDKAAAKTLLDSLGIELPA